MGEPTLITYHGVIVPLAVLARQHGHTPHRVRQRLRLGWTLDEAIQRPVSESKMARAIEQYLHNLTRRRTMSWLAIFQLATTLLAQAVQAFAQGHTHEATALVQLPPEHAAVVRTLAAQHPSMPPP